MSSLVKLHKLPRAQSPEAVGVSTPEILAFLEDLEASGIENHSFMVLRHGQVACESYVAPYHADMPHTLYSFSKSVAAIAMGFAVDEGLVSLKTRVKDIFPEYRQKKPDDNYEKLTIRHLLTMTSGREPSLFADKAKIDWIQDFIDAHSPYLPGEGWHYTNENLFMVCAILYKMTNTTVTDYLVQKLFIPLGIDRPFWETDKKGVEAGGWGLYLKTEDMAKIILCIQQGGMFAGRQVIPAWFAQDAGRALVENPGNSELDCDKGYGYCFWRNGGDPCSYRADGMFSQFGIVFERQDACLIMTNAHADEQEARDCIWRHFPKAFCEDGAAVPQEETQRLHHVIASREIKPLPIAQHSPLERELEGKTLCFKRSKLLNLAGFPVSVLPLAVTYMTTDKAGNIDHVQLAFKNTECSITWTEGDEINAVTCGMDGTYRPGAIRLGQIDYHTVSCATWLNESQLEIWIRPLETVGNRKLLFTFRGNRVTLKPSSTPSIRSIAATLVTAMKDLLKGNPPLCHAATFALRHFYGILEPNLHGRIV